MFVGQVLDDVYDNMSVNSQHLLSIFPIRNFQFTKALIKIHCFTFYQHQNSCQFQCSKTISSVCRSLDQGFPAAFWSAPSCSRRPLLMLVLRISRHYTTSHASMSILFQNRDRYTTSHACMSILLLNTDRYMTSHACMSILFQKRQNRDRYTISHACMSILFQNRDVI